MTENPISAPEGQEREAAPTVFSAETRNRQGSMLPLLSLIAASVAILLHFYTQIRHQSENYFGPLTWLPLSLTDAQITTYGGASDDPSSLQVAPKLITLEEEIAKLRQEVAQSVSDISSTKDGLTRLGQAAEQSASNSTSLNEALTSLRSVTDQSASAVTKLSADMEALRSTTAQTEATRLELAQATEAMRQVGAQVSDVESKVAGISKDLEVSRSESTAATSRLSSQIDSLSSSHDASLLATRIALSTSMGSVDSADIDALITRAQLNSSLTQALTELKALAGADIPTFDALRDALLARERSTISAVRASRMEWWELPVSYARYTLSDLGMSQPPEEEKDQVILDRVIHKLNNGRLEAALRELEAGSSELQKQLSTWTSAAELRVTFDRTLLQVVDALLDQQTAQKSPASPG